MAISYNKLWKLLIDNKMTKTDLKNATQTSSYTPNTFEMSMRFPLPPMWEALRCRLQMMKGKQLILSAP